MATFFAKTARGFRISAQDADSETSSLQSAVTNFKPATEEGEI
jgi:hypothetical protein